ncbi:MAG: hypothetical protein ACREOI_03575 [bacterium]
MNIAFRFQGFQIGQHDDREWIRAGLQLGHAITAINDLDDWIPEDHFASPVRATILTGTEARIGVRQKRQANNLFPEFIEDAIVVDIHSFRKLFVPVSLNLNVNEQPSFCAVLQKNFDQFIGKALAGFAGFDNFLQFLFQKLIAFGKINICVNVWKEGV